MKPSQKFAIALIAGAALSVFVGKGSRAQSLPPTYYIVDFSEITDPEGFKALAAKATPEILAGFGGKYVVRSQTVTAVEGVAPKRFVIIAFDTPDHAKAGRSSRTQGRFARRRRNRVRSSSKAWGSPDIG